MLKRGDTVRVALKGTVHHALRHEDEVNGYALTVKALNGVSFRAIVPANAVTKIEKDGTMETTVNL